MQAILLVALGSALGGVGRYLVAIAWVKVAGTGFPWETLIVNVVGSALIGWFAAVLPASDIRLLLMTGMLGGFTTFSSFSLQTVELIRNGEPGAAAFYVGVSVLACVAGAASGLWLGLHAVHQ